MCFKNFHPSKLNNLRWYVPQSLCSFVAKARVKCQFQWLHFLSPNFSFFLITQQSTQWMQRKIACQNYTQKMDSIANSSRIAGDRRLTQSWVLNTYIFLWFVFPSQGYSKTKKLKFLTDFFFDKRRLELFMGCNIKTNHHEKGRDKKQGNKQKHLSLGGAPPPPSI